MSADYVPAVEDLMALDLEYRLTIGFRAAAEGCDCVRYLIERREVLIPAVLRRAQESGDDPVDVFARFARNAHARHEAGGRLFSPATSPGADT